MQISADTKGEYQHGIDILFFFGIPDVGCGFYRFQGTNMW